MAKSKKNQYRTLRALSYKGERVETGTLLLLSSEDLKQINTDYIELLDEKKVKEEKDVKKKVEDEKAEGNEIDI